MNELQSEIDAVLKLTDFAQALDAVGVVDASISENIFQSLTSTIKDIHSSIDTHRDNQDKLLYLLLKEEMAIEGFITPIKRILTEIDAREKELWVYSIKSTSDFFDSFETSILGYFNRKKESIYLDIDSHFKWYSEFVGTINELFDYDSLLKKAVKKNLDPEILSKDLEEILKSSFDHYSREWARRIDMHTPAGSQSLGVREIFLGGTGITHEMGAGELVAISGLGTTVAATVTLAMGWHTLSWVAASLWPVTIFAVLGGAAFSWSTQEKSKEKLKKKVDELIDTYIKEIILKAERGVQGSAVKSLRQELNEMNQAHVSKAVSEWKKKIIGNFSKKEIEQIDAAARQHIQRVQNLRQKIEQPEGQPKEDDSTRKDHRNDLKIKKKQDGQQQVDFIYEEKLERTKLPRSGFKAYVDREDFLEVLKKTKVSKKIGKRNYENERAEFSFNGDDKTLTIYVIGATHRIKCKGVGTGSGKISLFHYLSLEKFPPKEDPVSIEHALGYPDSELKVGTSKFKTIEN